MSLSHLGWLVCEEKGSCCLWMCHCQAQDRPLAKQLLVFINDLELRLYICDLYYLSFQNLNT